MRHLGAWPPLLSSMIPPPPPLPHPAKQTWWGMSMHNTVKTHYVPLLFRPMDYFTGLRCLFGDQVGVRPRGTKGAAAQRSNQPALEPQVLFCRRRDFERVGGFDPKLPIMEDADLCLRMHRAGPEQKRDSHEKGRVRMLSRFVDSSGRRIAKWGNWKSTQIHFQIGIAWWLGQDLNDLYHSVYKDDAR